MSKPMDQATARRLLSEGAFFIFLDVPQGTEFGIDMKSWNTGEKFRGVKMIPPGMHYIFYNSVSTTEDVAPRIGFFHNFKKGEVLVKKWDKLSEQMSSEPVPEREIVSIKENLLAFDSFLGPYPYDILDKWKGLSANLTENLVKKLMPKSGQVKAALELQSCSDAERPRGAKKLKTDSEKRLSTEADLLPLLRPLEGTALQLTPFPDKNYPDGSSPSDITKHSLDSSYVFETLLRSYSEPADIMGELEFCYICFLVGHSFEAFDQWKKIVTVFCSCDAAIQKYRRLFDIFITVLEAQLTEIPEEFLADIVSNDNFVYVNLKKMFRVVHDSSLDGQLKTKIDRFRESLTEKFLWDFDQVDSEEEDEAPVVVDL